MLLYLFLLALCLLFTLRSVARLFTERFPDPVDFAILSVAYYGIPLSVAGYFDFSFDHRAFLAPFAADPGLAEMSLRYIVLAFFSLEAGRRVAASTGPSNITRFATTSIVTGERIRFSLLVFLVIIGVGILLFGINEFLSGYATESSDVTGVTGNALIYITLELIGLTIAYAVLVGQVRGRTPAKLLILISVFVFIVVLVIRAKRLEVVAALLPVLLVLLVRKKSSLSWRAFGAVAVIAVLLAVSVVRVSDTVSLEQITFLLFSEGLYAGHSLPGIEERLSVQSLDYEYGSRFVSSIIAFVPRFLWEGKDDLVYAGNLALKGVAPQGATNLLAEVILQGGAVAVAATYAIIGFVLERIGRVREGWDEAMTQGKIPARIGAYLIAMAIFIPHFRDGIIPSLKLSMQAAVVFLFLSAMPLRGGRAASDSASRNYAGAKLQG